MIILNVPAAFIVLFGLPRALYLRSRSTVKPTNSNLYLAKQGILAFLALAMLGEMWVAAIRGDYLFRTVSPAIQSFGLVRRKIPTEKFLEAKAATSVCVYTCPSVFGLFSYLPFFFFFFGCPFSFLLHLLLDCGIHCHDDGAQSRCTDLESPDAVLDVVAGGRRRAYAHHHFAVPRKRLAAHGKGNFTPLQLYFSVQPPSPWSPLIFPSTFSPNVLNSDSTAITTGGRWDSSCRMWRSTSSPSSCRSSKSPWPTAWKQILTPAPSAGRPFSPSFPSGGSIL